ncbi:hypothetical protein [Parvularcula lutaonensis]|uniref:Uncharacterized protein n=1 Tax=Parvularcula lutaonensis TaxID=491923 RepID=A0ABV7ME53_9PROT|nr:hypothetical protein [Parvularcula lutaonensis]GGY52008.1 hypothetical protein GCM10007148_21260 [Parvularcula lutaonensis]
MSPLRIPRDRADNFTADAAAKRAEFLREQTGADLPHVTASSVDLALLKFNTESLSAVVHGDWLSSHDELGRNRP